MSLLAESDNSSGEAGLFYSPGAAEYWEPTTIQTKYILVLVFRQETLLLKVKDLELQSNLSQLL